MMGQVLERAHSPLITPNATTSTSASASWNRLEWRRVVLAVSTALAVPLVVSTSRIIFERRLLILGLEMNSAGADKSGERRD